MTTTAKPALSPEVLAVALAMDELPEPLWSEVLRVTTDLVRQSQRRASVKAPNYSGHMGRLDLPGDIKR
jgi:hypothetical protein